jgi:LysM repeat protein|nr:MAG TPA: LysM [Caudoviricetes sp.]
MEYVVKSGESLWSIADKYLGSGLKYTDLIKLNNLSKDAVIYPG